MVQDGQHEEQSRLGRWRARARRLKIELAALALAYRDPRTPWYARVMAVLVVGYAFSPLDLIPDPIPVLGYLDDLLLVPLGIALALHLIPPQVMADCRAQAARSDAQAGATGPARWVAAAAIVALWLLAAWVVIRLVGLA
jgi:uncharacterized membrane protein YkvA (DUF1232 family)